jgi:hypothetical protein
MRRRIGIVLGIAFALLVATNLAFGGMFDGVFGGAFRGGVSARRHRPDVKALLSAPTFADVGEFTGALEGTIVLNGTPYRLAPEVGVYDVARGLLPAGTYVSNCVIACSGVTVGGSRVIYHIILRAGSEGQAIDDTPIRSVRIEDAGPR